MSGVKHARPPTSTLFRHFLRRNRSSPHQISQPILRQDFPLPTTFPSEVSRLRFLTQPLLFQLRFHTTRFEGLLLLLLFNDDDGYYVLDEEPESTVSFIGDGVCIEIKKLGKNSRKIRSKIGIDAGLDTVWNIMTDYEKLADIIPGLAVSKVVEKRGNCARLCQIAQQNLPLGLKFNAKVVLDCCEKDLEISPVGKKRDIEFKMVEGDFQCFEGKWSVEQFNGGQCEDGGASFGRNFQTSLSYAVDFKPKLWLPVHLIDGRICREIKTSLSYIREEAKKVIGTLRSL